MKLISKFCFFLYLVFLVGCAANVTHLGKLGSVEVQTVEIQLMNNDIDSMNLNQFNSIEFNFTDNAFSSLKGTVLIFDQKTKHTYQVENVNLTKSLNDRQIEINPSAIDLNNCKQSDNSTQLIENYINNNHMVNQKLPNSFINKNKSKKICLFKIEVLVAKSSTYNIYRNGTMVYGKNMSFKEAQAAAIESNSPQFALDTFKAYFKSGSKTSSYDLLEAVRMFKEPLKAELIQDILVNTNMKITGTDYVRLIRYIDKEKRADLFVHGLSHLNHPLLVSEIIYAFKAIDAEARLSVLQSTINAKKFVTYLELSNITEILTFLPTNDRLSALQEIAPNVRVLDDEKSEFDSLLLIIDVNQRKNAEVILQSFEFV